MPRCTAAMGILGEVSKMCCLVEDSHRHLRCRGMTSQSFALEMPILKRNSKFKIQNSKLIYQHVIPPKAYRLEDWNLSGKRITIADE